MQMHNKMEGCFVTAPTTPWAGKELWYKQCGRAEVPCRKSPQKGQFPAISGDRNYMFSWFTRHVAYLLFLTTAAFRLSKRKGNRIIYISGRQQIFLSGIFVRLHFLSFLRLIYPFSDSLVCNSVYRASFLFRTESKESFISLHGQEMERTVARLIDLFL